MTTALAIAALILVAVMWGRTAGHAWATDAPLIEKIRDYRVKTAELRSRKCLPVIPVLTRSEQIPPEWRLVIAERWRMRWVRSQFAGQHCPRTVEQVIRAVFPDETEDAAVKVAWCESKLYRYAKNRNSSASGPWQFLSSWWYGKFDPFDPWASSRVALAASDGGKDWGPWRASYSCHGQS